MKLLKPLVLTTALVLTATLPTMALAQTCKVTDPTATPLNVRATPNGKIVGKLKNGTKVRIIEEDYDDKNRPWALVVNTKNNKRIGWVIREYISCYQ